MRKLAFLLVLCFVGYCLNAQTEKELVGKWKLVRYVEHGKEKDIKAKFKTDQVYQVFTEDGKFQGIVGDKVTKGKWKMSKNKSSLTIRTIIPVKFKIEHFDAERRVISSSSVGTLEYKKVPG